MSDGWKPADEPPAGRVGKWTADVVAATNLGNVFKLAYFHGDDNGCWQRPSAFLDGELVEHWMPMPK